MADFVDIADLALRKMYIHVNVQCASIYTFLPVKELKIIQASKGPSE